MSRVGGGISIQGKGRGDLLVLLEQAQNKFGYLSQELMAELAQSVGVSISDVYGVASFYSFLSTKPKGRNVIRICKSLPCFLQNSRSIVETIEREIGIKPGETTPDGRFSLELVNCVGACEKAPVMIINNNVHADLTLAKIARILKSYK